MNSLSFSSEGPHQNLHNDALHHQPKDQMARNATTQPFSTTLVTTKMQKYGITSEQLDARRENAQGDAQGVDKVVKETDAVKYGLNVFAPTAAVVEEDTPMEQKADQQEERAVKKTADQLAIDALTGAAPTSTLTIPAAAAATEEDAFADSFHSAPPAPSLSDYAAVPVEEYGAAMLRGMGWKGPSTTPSLPTKNGKNHFHPQNDRHC
ncbi:unnamed protein product [Aureobasidium pullulans]|nr:unnamed protein product [Aureobasidium pullulans]